MATIASFQEALDRRKRDRVGWQFSPPLIARRTRTTQLVLVIAIVIAIGATIWSAATHSMLLYGDARAHLDVARRVTDGLTPGLVQLGSVWLPLPHLLLVPLVMIEPLWHSGAAGAIVGGACFAYSVLRIYTMIDELASTRVAAWIGAAVFATNLNLLYLQTTALTEPVLLAFSIGAVYHFVCWTRSLSVRHLTWCGVLTFCATLTRYEGWALLAALAPAVLLWSRYADRRWKAPQANIIFYGVVACCGIALWLLYNLVIFHDALYFLHSAYSAQVINGGQARFGLLGTKGDLGASILTYGWAIFGVIGPVVLAMTAAACVVVVLTRRPQRRRSAVTLALLAVPMVFEVGSLFAGQTTIRVPQLAPYSMWNDRYGIMALPVCAVAIGLLSDRLRWSAIPVAVGTIAAVVVMGIGTPLALADGQTGTSSAAAGRPERAAAYLGNHYRGGQVLADDSFGSALIFASHLDLAEFVTVGAEPYWHRALSEPARSVRWVVSFPGDEVAKDMRNHPDRFVDFNLVHRDGSTRIYQRAADSGGG